MSEAKFRSDLPVWEVRDGCCGSDALIARAAWVQPPGSRREGEGDDAYRRVLKSMLKGRHGTPFEKGLMTVYVEAPAVVWWEWTRHRFMGLDCEDQSFSLESGRYKVLDGVFYLPPNERALREPDGFKPMRPVLVAADDESAHCTNTCLRHSCNVAWSNYQNIIGGGIAREVARLVLPFSVYYAGYVSANPRTWLQFFSLRRGVDGAAHPTFPQWEIADVCHQCEAIFAHRWPITYAAFNECGRVSP